MPAREQQMSEAFRALYNAEIEKWWAIIKAAGIKSEWSREYWPRHSNNRVWVLVA